MNELSKCAPGEALRNLEKAFKNFFRRCKQDLKKKGYPKFKSKKNGIGSFRLEGCIHVLTNRIKLPKIGFVRLAEKRYVPVESVSLNARILSVTISEKAGNWYASVAVEEEINLPKGTEILGVDVGVKTLATLSDGSVFENPRALKKAQSKLRRLNKALSRREPDSKNRTKAKFALSMAHLRIANIRKDAIHKATTAIAKRCSIVGVESLNVAGMLKNHNLAQAISDASMSEFLRQLKYKMEWRGGVVVEAGRFYPSSKTCSRCGTIKKDLTLGDRIYECDSCRIQIDRDLNAAINLRELAVRSTVTVCGESSSGPFAHARGETRFYEAGTEHAT